MARMTTENEMAKVIELNNSELLKNAGLKISELTDVNGDTVLKTVVSRKSTDDETLVMNEVNKQLTDLGLTVSVMSNLNGEAILPVIK